MLNIFSESYLNLVRLTLIHNQSHATQDTYVGFNKSHVSLTMRCYNRDIQTNLPIITIIKGRSYDYRHQAYKVQGRNRNRY